MGPQHCVIIPTFGHFEYAVAAVESCFAHTDDVVVLVIDDASPAWSSSEKIAPGFLKLTQKHPERLVFVQFTAHGGLTRSWNKGLALARHIEAVYTTCANSDVIFTPGWSDVLSYHLEHGYDLVGPLSNAPGVTSRGQQDIGNWLAPSEYTLTDAPEYLQDLALSLRREHFYKTVEAPVNGFCFTAKTAKWWEYAFDELHVFNPSNQYNSKGESNPTPTMTLNEDEFERRLTDRGGRIAVCPGAFVLHYRAVSRGDRYKTGRWLRRDASKR